MDPQEEQQKPIVTLPEDFSFDAFMKYYPYPQYFETRLQVKPYEKSINNKFWRLYQQGKIEPVFIEDVINRVRQKRKFLAAEN
jgi:hypothetical protein